MTESEFSNERGAERDRNLAEVILAGLTYEELHAKAIYLMWLNGNQACTIDGLADDAARYRWLREGQNGAELFYAVADLEGEALDAAVDNAMWEQRHE